MSTEAVLNHHLTNFGAGNVVEMLKDYTDESLVVGPTATIRGRDAIGALFTEWFETFFRPGTYDFTMDRLEIQGDFAYIVWHAECDGLDFTLGTDTFVVNNGKIVYQTYAAKVEPK